MQSINNIHTIKGKYRLFGLLFVIGSALLYIQ
jgi:hypothetical protein